MIAINTKMPKGCWGCNFCYDNKGYYCAINNNLLASSIVDIPNERPSSCPLVEVVTCKDCDNRCTGGLCTKHNITVTKDFYCADAERRE